jgi:hypothetical protein
VTKILEENSVRLESASSLRVLVFVLTVALMTIDPGVPAFAAAPAIGTVVAKGAFRLDHATVTGNATLFEGASIETALVASSMELATGAKISLDPSSRGKFFGDHVILEKGAGRLEKAEGFKFEARGLIIQPETGNASARIALAGATRVDVSALSGSFRVLNSRGLLVANLKMGRTLEFEPQAPNTPWRASGCLVNRGGHFLITDETTNVVIEVAGAGLDKEKDNMVEVAGAMDPTATPVSDASQFVRVTSVKRLGKGCVGTAAAGSGGAPGAPAAPGAGAPGKASGGGAGGGLSTTMIAIIGGVAAAGAVGGLAASGALSGQGSTVSR